VNDTTPLVAQPDTEDHFDEAEPGESAEVAYGAPVTYSRGQRVIHPARDTWRSTAEALLADGWTMCADLTVVDYLGHQTPRELPPGVEPERFEVVASFVSHPRRERIRARCQVTEAEPTIDSLYALYPGTDFMEREAYDMFGVTFAGHPDLSRILMPETWEGHPLRKDYAIGAIPVQFKAQSTRGQE
jgi:NADH-quinone oxidoreductase subunit C